MNVGRGHPRAGHRRGRAVGYWWELSLRQVEVSRTLVFDAPRQARAFFEALVADNLDLVLQPDFVTWRRSRDGRGTATA